MKKTLLKSKLEELKKEREITPEVSMMGDKNWVILDTQIEALEKLAEDPTDDNLSEMAHANEEKISEIEDNYTDSQYTEMDQERKPYQELDDLFYELEG